MNMPQFYVYQLKNKINNKIYIGESKDPYKRLIRHKSNANCNKGYIIHSAIRKYGIESFDFSILFSYKTEEDALNKEKELIKELKSNQKEFGYNITEGGYGSFHGPLSEEHKRKISISLTGKIQSKETRQKLSEARLGVELGPQTLEHRLKISEGLKKFNGERLRPIISEDFINKCILALNRRGQISDEAKSQIINDYATGNFTKKQLAKINNISCSSVNYIVLQYKNGILSEEQKHKNRSNAHLGKKHSEEHKRKISAANMGRIISEESREKISLANAGENNGMSGKTHSIDVKQKMSEFQSSRPREPLTEEHKQKNREAVKKQDFSYRIPKEIKKLIIQLYSSGNYTKKQLSEKFVLKYNSIVKIIRTHKVEDKL